MSEHLPSLWWKRKGPVAVWTVGGVWDSWDAELHARREPLLDELGTKAASALASSLIVVGDRLYWPHREPPVRTGQLGLDFATNGAS